MKVNIGPYINWTGPYQISRKILFWKDRDCESIHKFGTWLAENSKGEDSLLMKLCSWWHSKQKRKVKIQIDNYDVWSMDSTLALIIKPMLIKLKEQKHGVAWIDNADVPEELRDSDNGYSEAKYNWFLDELIWAFGFIVEDEYDNVDEYVANTKRADKAFILFGKYFRTLWD